MNELCTNEERVPLMGSAGIEDRLPAYRRVAYSFGTVLNDTCATLWFSYTLLYLQKVLGMEPILAGFLLMLGLVANAVATSLIGVLSHRFGTKRMWHMAGTCLVILSFPLIFETHTSCDIMPLVLDIPLTKDNQTIPIARDNESIPLRVNDQTNPLVLDNQSIPIVVNNQTISVIQYNKTIPLVLDNQTIPIVMDNQTIPIVVDNQTIPIVEDNQTIPIVVDNQTTPIVEDNDAVPILEPTTPNPVNDWPFITYYVVVIVLFQVGFAMVQISHLAMIPELSQSQRGRAELTSIRYTGAVSSATTVFVVAWVVFHSTKSQDVIANTIGPCDAFKFREIVLICLAVGIPFVVLFHLSLRQANRQGVRVLPSSSQHRKVQRTLGSYFRSPLLFQVALMYVANRLFVDLSEAYVPLYLDEGLSEEAEVLATVPLVFFISAFLSTFGIKYFINKFGSKVSYLLGGVTSLAGCIWIAYGSGQDFISKGVYGVAVLLGSGSAITYVTSLCLAAELIGTDTDTGAFVYSIVILADKLTTGWAFVAIEYNKCPSGEQCPHYYRDVLAYVCGGAALLGLAVLATLAPASLGDRSVDPAPSQPQGGPSGLSRKSPRNSLGSPPGDGAS